MILAFKRAPFPITVAVFPIPIEASARCRSTDPRHGPRPVRESPELHRLRMADEQTAVNSHFRHPANFV